MTYAAHTQLTPVPGGGQIHFDLGDEEVAGAAGDLVKVLNDSGHDRLITEAVLYSIVPAGGASTLDLGVDDAGDTAVDTVLDGADLAAVAGTVTSMRSGTGNADVAGVVWPNGTYLTGTKKTGAGSAENSLKATLTIAWMQIGA